MGEKDAPESGDRVHLQHILIKWTGGKRRQARRIVGHFPRKIATYLPRAVPRRLEVSA